MALQFNSDNFKAEVLQSDQPVLVDFWAEWCGPCKMIGPLVDAVASDTEGTAKVGKVDVDTEQELARTYNIQSLPTIAFFKGGEIVETMIGTQGVTVDVLKGKLDALAQAPGS